MVKLGPNGGANVVRYRRCLFLTTAIVALVCSGAGLRPACAQSVTGNNVSPGPVQTPNWSVGSDLFIGSGGNGTLLIQDGGTVTNDTGFVGNGPSEQGEVTVSGHDGSGNASTWTNNGDLVVGQSGTGTLLIENGGLVSNAGAYIGADTGSQGDITISGRDVNGNASTWTSTGSVYIGDSGTGALNINDGGVVNSALAIIGNSSGGTGTVTVSGHDSNGNASTWNNTNQIYVGMDGTGTLRILDGGVVNSGQGLIGYSGAGPNSVTVSGRDINGNASTWNAANNIYVGFSGSGTLNVADGAAVATSGAGGAAASIFIGYLNGGTGTVNVSSNTGNVSSLTATDSINVGYIGTGTMTVDKGGFVSVGRNVRITYGPASSGTLHLNGDATGRGIVETGSVIRGIGATAILDLNGGILRANRDEANFLNGFTALTVGAGGAWFDTNAHDIIIGTDFSGTSSFNKLGLGQLTLTGDSSGFTGASTVSAGTLAVNGVLGGNMLVDTAGRLVGTGSVGNVVNTGVVAPGYGNAMGTLTVQGNYASTGGRLEIATVLGGDSSPTSRLVVDGTTSGITQVGIINRGGLGGQTVEGIKIVEVDGASNGSFLLVGNYVFHGAQAVTAGAYAYRLYQGGVSTPTDGDWYLRSALLDPGTPSGPGDPAPTPLYQPGVPVYEAYSANLQSLNTLPTLQQRVGNRTWAPGADADGNGIWGRMEGTHGHFSDAPTSTTGLNQSIDTWKLQAGVDRVFVDPDKGGRLVAGLNVSYGGANSQINSVFGNGVVNSEGYGLGATLTWYGGDGFYVDGQAQVNRYNSDLGSDLLGSLTRDNGGYGEAFSIEAGKRIAFGGGFGVTPQVQTVYSNVRFNRFTDLSDAVVSADGNDSLKTRWGVALDHRNVWEGGRSHIYGIANVSYEWLNGMRTLVSGTPIVNADERLWGELGLGASMIWREELTLYSEVSGNSPFSDFGNSYVLKGNVGLRLQF